MDQDFGMVIVKRVVFWLQVIQRDVECHHKTVQSVVKLCEKLSQSNHPTGPLNGVRRESPLQKAQRWERRWQQLYLRCIEWQCYIEQRLEYLRFEVSFILCKTWIGMGILSHHITSWTTVLRLRLCVLFFTWFSVCAWQFVPCWVLVSCKNIKNRIH